MSGSDFSLGVHSWPLSQRLLPMYQPCTTWLSPRVSFFVLVACACHLVIVSHWFSSIDNTEIITNSVIILFICDLDELLYRILMVSPRWVKSMSQEEHNESDSELAIRDGGFDSKSFCWNIVPTWQDFLLRRRQTRMRMRMNSDTSLHWHCHQGRLLCRPILLE